MTQQDLRRKVRSHGSPLAVAFVVDNSYSVHAEQLVEKVRGLALTLIEDAAHHRDKIALVAFKGGVPEATVAVPLTRSLQLARRRLAEVPLAGRTPLADALARARRVLRQETWKNRNAIPVLVVVSDGLPTVALRPGGDPLRDVLAEGRRLRRERVCTVIAEAARPGARAGGCGLQLAEIAGGSIIPLEELTHDSLSGLLAAIGVSPAGLGQAEPRAE